MKSHVRIQKKTIFAGFQIELQIKIADLDFLSLKTSSKKLQENDSPSDFQRYSKFGKATYFWNIQNKKAFLLFSSSLSALSTFAVKYKIS